MTVLRNKMILAGAIAALGAGTLGPIGVAQAKHGSDDPPSHDARDDHGGRHAHSARHHVRARHHHGRHGHGRDDRPGDDHGGR